jgi:hypothetical protein
MPIESTTTPAMMAPAPPTLGPSSHRITYMDLQGVTRELKTSGSVLVMDPALALRCEMAGLEYTFLNPAGVLWLSVEALSVPPAVVPTLELLEEQIPEPVTNGTPEGDN